MQDERSSMKVNVLDTKLVKDGSCMFSSTDSTVSTLQQHYTQNSYLTHNPIGDNVKRTIAIAEILVENKTLIRLEVDDRVLVNWHGTLQELNSNIGIHMHACAHSKNRNVVVTKCMLFQFNVGHKDTILL